VMQMQTSQATSIHNGALAKAAIPSINGHPDYDMINALAKVSPTAQGKAKATSQDFEAMFLNSMFSQMTSGLQGEGPYGSTTGTGVWRSMLTEQYSKSFAQAGGVGIAKDVYRTLILQQANRIGQTQIGQSQDKQA
jgi:peptidoglycan hydrolase FlgJ